MGEVWKNWSGSVVCAPRQIARPSTEHELASLLRESAGEVRVAGNGHSFTPLCATDGMLVSLTGMSGVVGTGAEGGSATIMAGTPLHAIGEPLRRAGLALANMGDIDRQALGGAVGTGTHGTGRTLGSFSTQVIALRIALASGELVDCSPAVEPDLFAAARLSLGALGVVMRLTLRVMPAYRLHQRTWPLPFEECLDQLDTSIAANRHFEFFWSPVDDLCAMKTLNLSNRPIRTVAPAPPSQGRMSRYLGPERIEWSYRIFPSERNLPFNEMEYAVPEEAGPDCVREIRELMRTRHPDVIWPIEYRTLRADDVPLSPAHGRPTVTISIHQAADLPREAFFADAEAIFRNHHGRPHWGKLHSLTVRDFRDLYPRFDRFRAVRERADPSGRFLNQHLRTMLVE
jgi:FAD/FMN-containing dehydrogenase